MEKDTTKQNTTVDQAAFRKLSRLYLLALSAIALSIILSQLLVQSHLTNQQGDARAINVAGRQRMLSQKLSKEALLLREDITQDNTLDTNWHDLERTLDLWQRAHEGLLHGDRSMSLSGKKSAALAQMFAELQPSFDQILQHTQSILNQLRQPSDSIPTSTLLPAIDSILQYESIFLEHMDAIVFQYDEEANEKLIVLSRTEWILLLVSILILLLELFFIFRPTAKYVQQTISKLLSREKDAKEMTHKVEELYKQKEASLQELRALNFAVDQAALFASVSSSGEVIYMSNKFKKFLGLEDREIDGPLAELMSVKEGDQQYIQSILDNAYSNIWTGEVRIQTPRGETVWLEMSSVPVNRSGVRKDFLLLCTDITSRKVAQLEIDRLQEDRFAEEFRQQQLRAAQIIEAQEEERKRIARDMHDGIGQMLTALKFNLESINIDKTKRAKEKLEGLKSLTSNLIKGVRIATFNLTPPELTDYGIVTTLAKLAKELKKLTNKNIVFENQSGFNGRFDSLIETNLYRITQEAVNNAIKYADANYILITLKHSDQLLSIVIDDDGRGFDPKAIAADSQSKNSSGMGLAFMRERVKYIDGRLFVHTEPGAGTRITINMPI